MATTNAEPAQLKAQHSVAALVAKADELVGRCELELGASFLERALQLEPANTAVMDSLAAVRLGLGNIETAHELLTKSIHVAPDQGHEKYMQLAQLLTGTAAAQCTLRGIAVVEAAMARCRAHFGPGGEAALPALSQALAAAYCSLVELYMTDLCDASDAEAHCEQYVAAALAADPAGLEPLQALASLRLCQQRPKEAAAAAAEAAGRLAKLQETTGILSMATGAGRRMPPYDTRVALVQLLLETGQPKPALDQCHRLLHENDAVVHVWYLGGIAAKESGDRRHAAELLTRAQAMLKKAGEGMDEATASTEVAPQLATISGLLQGLLDK